VAISGGVFRFFFLTHTIVTKPEMDVTVTLSNHYRTLFLFNGTNSTSSSVVSPPLSISSLSSESVSQPAAFNPLPETFAPPAIPAPPLPLLLGGADV
jgi:hypothetical protein